MGLVSRQESSGVKCEAPCHLFVVEKQTYHQENRMYGNVTDLLVGTHNAAAVHIDRKTQRQGAPEF